MLIKHTPWINSSLIKSGFSSWLSRIKYKTVNPVLINWSIIEELYKNNKPCSIVCFHSQLAYCTYLARKFKGTVFFDDKTVSHELSEILLHFGYNISYIKENNKSLNNLTYEKCKLKYPYWYGISKDDKDRVFPEEWCQQYSIPIIPIVFSSSTIKKDSIEMEYPGFPGKPFVIVGTPITHPILYNSSENPTILIMKQLEHWKSLLERMLISIQNSHL